MGKERPFLATLNGGEVSPLALGRVDLKRMAFTADTMLNIFPRVIGPMQLRPGTEYLGTLPGKTKQLPFIFSAEDVAMVELYDQGLRVSRAGTPISRVAVGTTIPNGDFNSATGWTLTTGGGIAQITGGQLRLNSSVRGSRPKCTRQITVVAGDRNKEHALRLTVARGPVRLRVGSISGGDDYIREAQYTTGVYSLTFTPTNDFYLTLVTSKIERDVLVEEIQVEPAGVLNLPAPWLEAHLNQCRVDQSGDVLFVANSTRLYQTRRIERRHNSTSWGITLHENLDGPFRGKTANIQLTPSVSSGVGTMTASDSFFQPEHVGTIFRLYYSNVTIQQTLAGNDQFTDPIRVSGKDNNERGISVTRGGSWVGSGVYQASYDEGETWTVYLTFTAPLNTTETPGNANQVVLWRAGFGAGQYTSGSMNITATYDGGSGWGIVRVTGYNSPTSVNIDVVKRIYRTGVACTEWEEGKFSDVVGWPSACCFFDGRFWLGDKDNVYGSVSDAFDSLDLDVEGDSGPIIRSIATGPVNRALSMLGLARLGIMTSGAESIGRSSSFDEPMTPTNFSIKDASTLGSADVASVKVDRSGIFIQRSGKRAYVTSFNVEAQDYTSTDVSKYHPTILEAGVVGVAVQRQPDTRIWFWLADGTAAILVYEPQEDVISWTRFQTDGVIEDIAILPNLDADDVYMVVRRNINGVDVRYRERLAYDDAAQGGTNNSIADAMRIQTITATNVIANLAHLNGKQVVAWVAGSPLLDANGDPALFAVAGGQINIGAAKTGIAVAGLPYVGRWKSTKLAYGAQMGTAVSQPKRVADFAPVLYKSHIRALKYGRDFDHLAYMRRTVKGESKPMDTFLDDYDGVSMGFEGNWDTDSRICLEMRAPLPCTVLGFAGAVDTHERG